jgi:hypothetical protein
MRIFSPHASLIGYLVLILTSRIVWLRENIDT